MKKILVLFAVLLVAFMVFACGQDKTTTPAATTAATTTAKTTVATTVATTEATTVATTTVATTTPITPGDVYVDLDFDAEEGTMVDKMGNVTLKPSNDKVFVDTVTITHNGITKENVPALTVTATNSWVECTFKNLADYAQLNKLVEEVKGWTVEAFYLNLDKNNIVGIVCVTEGNAKDEAGKGYGKQGWGIAENKDYPYFLTGNTAGYLSTGQTKVKAGSEEFVHVVGVYDATAKKNTLYINGKMVNEVAADGFSAAQGASKDGFVMGNGFFLGGDPSVSAACDFPASNLAIVEAKIYAGALTAAQVLEAYKATAADFQNEVIPEGNKIVAYVPAGKTDTAVNLASGLPVGALTLPAETEITLDGGYLYLVESKAGKLEVVSKLGAAVVDKKTTMGWTNANVKGTRQLSYGSYWMKPTGAAMATYKYNGFMDTAAINTAMGDNAATVGKFGTLTFNAINEDSFSVYFDGNVENVDFITDYKVNFVYVNYDGSALKKAKGSDWTPLAFNQVALRYAACDVALGKDIGSSQFLWQEAMRTYGGLPSVITMDGKYNGTTQQNYYGAEFKATSIPSQYASALANYIKYTTTAGKTEAQIAKDLADANTALAAAQKAFDDAVAANATVKALKDAITPLEAAYTATRQPEYEARAAHETAKANKAENEAELKAVRDAKTAAMNEAKAPYDVAVKAYNDAVEADATLKALNAELVVNATARNNITNNTPEKNTTDNLYVSKATLQAAAQVRQTGVDNYKKWAPLYEKFMAAYEAAANVALWTPEMKEAGDFKESPLYKAFKDIPAKIDNKDNISYPTFTYYYDVATETYIIFVTSATQTNTVAEFTKDTTNNNSVVTGQNWLIAAKLPEVAE